MKTVSICSVLVLTCLTDVAPVRASPIAPTVQVTIDGRSVELPAVTGDGKLWRLEYTDTTAPAPLSFVVHGDTDPFIDYTFGINNPLTVPLDISFTVASPYVGGPYNRLTLRHGDTVTDPVPDGNVEIVPNNQIFVAEAGLDGVVVAGLGSGCAVTTPLLPQTCFPESQTATPVSSLDTGVFYIVVSFTMLGGDLYEASGRVTLDNARQVPEPSALLLIGAAIVGVVLARRRH